MKRALYVAFEGPKGSGKSTALAAVSAEMRRRGVAHTVVGTTRPMPPWHPLERMARLTVLREWDRFRERLYAARANYAAQCCPEDAALVLGDRSILTSYVTRWKGHSPASRAAVVRRADRLEHQVRLPDHVLLFQAPVHVLLDRIRSRERSYGAVDETSPRLAAAMAAYTDLQSFRDELGLGAVRWHPVDASMDREAVAAAALSVVKRLLGGE